MIFNRTNYLFLILSLIIFSNLYSQVEEKADRHTFDITEHIITTPVKNQGRSGTCWAFATTSFVETEILRLTGEAYHLSEMYFVRNKLRSMGRNLIRFHGKANFGQGGQAHDVFNAIKTGGMLPVEIYSGKNIGKDFHDHGEFDAVLQGILDAVLKQGSTVLTPVWETAFDKVIDTYLGEVPEKFNFNEKEFTPKSFTEMTQFNPDDYIEITSYTHHPFYEKFVLELPDNWALGEYYNVPIDDLVKIINYAIENNYSVCWDGDSGRDNFYRSEGYAVIPEDEDNNSNEPEKEKIITQEMRQEAFDNYDVTDDHLMHIVGLAKDQAGTTFYLTKNSWGTKDKKYDGYWYMSEPYIRLKTVAIVLHKGALPEELKSKLNLNK